MSTDIAQLIPIIGPMLSDAGIRWWALAAWALLGPLPVDAPEDKTGRGWRWKWGGVSRGIVALAGAIVDWLISKSANETMQTTELRDLRQAVDRLNVTQSKLIAVLDRIIPKSTVSESDAPPPSRQVSQHDAE